MEELIKQKEKAAQEVNNNKTKLESRCQELESRNYELEQTVRYGNCSCGLVLSVVKMVLQLVCSSCMPMTLHV
jgi:hypothetical protein